MVTRKCKLKFIFLDIFILLCLVGGLLFYLRRERGEACLLEYTLLFTVPDYAADAFEIGVPLLDGVGKGVCGHVSHVTASNALLETEGELWEDGDTKRVTVTVRGEGRRKGGALFIGSISPHVGRRFYFHAPCVAEGLCVGVRRL